VAGLPSLSHCGVMLHLVPRCGKPISGESGLLPISRSRQFSDFCGSLKSIARGRVMRRDPADLLDVAERIAATENRLANLQIRVERLYSEGSDASQTKEVLDLTRSSLGQLYSRQSSLRAEVDRP
jgi:hypothetical protein